MPTDSGDDRGGGMQSTLTGIAILAAGGASRFGGIKQLAIYNGQTLVRRAVEQCIAVRDSCVALIVGSHGDRVVENVCDFCVDIEVVFNCDWQNGLSTSIGHAVEWAVRRQCAGLVLVCCDQPKISAAHIERLIECGRTQQLMACSNYDETQGVPAYFPAFAFEELSRLRGDRGAKALFGKWSEKTISIPIPEAGIDIDCCADLTSLNEADEKGKLM